MVGGSTSNLRGELAGVRPAVFNSARVLAASVSDDAGLRGELRVYLDTLSITGDNIGDIRRSLFVPWESSWNGWVRDETAAREQRRK